MGDAESQPLVGGGDFDRDGGPGKRGRTFRLHEQLEPERMQKMPYGSKGTRRTRPGFPAVSSMYGGGQAREFGQRQVSGLQAFQLLGKYITAVVVGVGLFFVVAYCVNHFVQQMTYRSFQGR